MKPAASMQFWRERTPRERLILALGGALLLVVLGWLLLIEPALQGREQWEKNLVAMRSDHLQMQALARQAAAMPAPPPGGPSPMPDRAGLERSLAAQGLKPQTLTLTGSTLRLTLADVSFSALADWLQQAQRDSQLVVSEASVTARERIDRVDASLTLGRPQ